MRCGDCRHFVEDGTYAPMGTCSRWTKGYHVEFKDLAPNEVLIEDDEGWGMMCGPEFGCVLFESEQVIFQDGK
jgi:hypothetical protein